MTYVEKISKKGTDYFFITFGAFLYAIGTSLFNDPNNIAPGGITGAAIVLNRIVPIGTGIWFMLMNIPILFLAIYKFGIRFTISTIYATIANSIFTDLLAKYATGFIVKDVMLGAIFGSAFVAVGIGITFKSHATTGGTDVIIKVLRLKYPHIKTGVLFLISDVFVVTFAGIVLRDIKVVLYSFLAVMITSFVIDFVLYGRDEAKLIYIISDNTDKITSRLLEELDVGVTHVFGQGAYSGEEKKVILCAIKKRLSPLAEDIVREEDPDAFMIVTSASEIFGEGYKSYFDERI
ncbi:YitT family protein [Butyrivibrio sp. XPD2002]|uniref:YitT family protein n=1 Tax=Butyrivibrio sp. XPD2002 TaxID=1280665 RepID=UPI0004146C62|nr:YitT family protein [Butyrivibrio sp. XPD2002]